MTNQDDQPFHGPLTLRFTGVDDESVSEDENNDITTQTSNPVVFTCNGNTNHLAVNNCYGI